MEGRYGLGANESDDRTLNHGYLMKTTITGNKLQVHTLDVDSGASLSQHACD